MSWVNIFNPRPSPTRPRTQLSSPQMNQTATETKAATTPLQTGRNSQTTHVDLVLGQSVKDKRSLRLNPVLLSVTQTTPHLSPPGPAVIHVEDMAQGPPAPEPMAQQGCKIDARHPSPVCPEVVSADSACILTTPERPCADNKAAVPQNRCCGGQARLTAQAGGKEKEISQLLGKPNLSKNREHKLPSANQATATSDGAGASPPHKGKRQPCNGRMQNCLHVNQFSRILPTEEYTWARHTDVSGFFSFPPTGLENKEEADKALAELSLNQKSSLTGLELEIDNALDDYIQETKAFTVFFEQYNSQMKKLGDDRDLTAQTLSQLEANTESLCQGILKRPEAEIPQVHQDTLRSAMAMKGQLTDRLEDIKKQQKSKFALANKVLERSLYTDFDHNRLIEDERRRAREAQTLKERREWETRMTALWRVGEGTAEYRKAWGWLDVEHENRYPKIMPTYPTGHVTTPRERTPACSRGFNETQQEIKIPPWFTVLDAAKRVELEGETPEARYQFVIRVLTEIWSPRKSEEPAAPVEKKIWTKEWHDPKPDWPTPNRQKHGGWWTCRSGPDAPRAEQECRLCHKKEATQARGVQPRTKPGQSSRQQRDQARDEDQARLDDDRPSLRTPEYRKRLLAEYERAVAMCIEKDKKDLHERFEQHRLEMEAHDRAREALDKNTPKDDTIRVIVASPPDGKGNELFTYGRARRLPKKNDNGKDKHLTVPAGSRSGPGDSSGSE